MEKHIPEEEYNKGESKQEYKIPLPFGDDETYEVSKEDYDEWIKKEEKRRQKDNEFQEKWRKHRKELDALWYVPGEWESMKYNIKYQERLKFVLGQRDISHIQQIPAYCEKQKTSTWLQLFSSLHWLAKVDVNHDIYHQQLTCALDNFENRIATTYLHEQDIDSVMQIFVLWNISDPALFHRFEILKIQNIKNFLRRIFLYGEHDARDISSINTIQEKQYLSSYPDMRWLYIFLRSRWCVVSDIEPDQHVLKEKIKKSYKHAVKKCIGTSDYDNQYFHIFSLLPDEDMYARLSQDEKDILQREREKYDYIKIPERWDTMLDYEKNELIMDIRVHGNLEQSIWHEKDLYRYGWNFWFLPGDLQQYLWFSKDDVNSRFYQAKKEFIEQFPLFVDKLSRDFISSDIYTWDYTNSFPCEIEIKQLPSILEKIEEALPFYDISLDVFSLRNTLVQKLTEILNQWIQKIKDKEKHWDKVSWKERKTLSYKYWIQDAVQKIDWVYTVLQKIDPLSAKNLDWAENKEQYMYEYQEYHKNLFIEKRVHSILTLEQLASDDLEKIQEMIVANWEKELINACLKHIQLKHEGPFSNFVHISSRQMFSFIKRDALFNKWYSSLLKYVYPDDKQRRLVRSEIIRSIIKNSLLTIQKKLLSYDNFHDAFYYMIDPLKYRYKKYHWDVRHVGLKYTKIQQQYFAFLDTQIQKQQIENISTIEADLERKWLDVKDIIKAYWLLSATIWMTHGYIQKLLKHKKNDLSKKYILDEIYRDWVSWPLNFWNQKNKQHEGIYSRDCLFFMSLWWYSIDDLNEIFSPDLQEHMRTFFHNVTKVKKNIWIRLLSYWFANNASPGGKLNRIVDEQLFIKFGHIGSITNEHINFVIDYLLQNMQTIFSTDIDNGLFDWAVRFFSDEVVIKELLQEFLEKRKTSLDMDMLSLTD